MNSKMQSEIDRRREDWTKKKLNCVEIYRQKEHIPKWETPMMMVEIQKEKDEKAIK